MSANRTAPRTGTGLPTGTTHAVLRSTAQPEGLKMSANTTTPTTTTHAGNADPLAARSALEARGALANYVPDAVADAARALEAGNPNAASNAAWQTVAESHRATIGQWAAPAVTDGSSARHLSSVLAMRDVKVPVKSLQTWAIRAQIETETSLPFALTGAILSAHGNANAAARTWATDHAAAIRYAVETANGDADALKGDLKVMLESVRDARAIADALATLKDHGYQSVTNGSGNRIEL